MSAGPVFAAGEGAPQAATVTGSSLQTKLWLTHRSHKIHVLFDDPRQIIEPERNVEALDLRLGEAGDSQTRGSRIAPGARSDPGTRFFWAGEGITRGSEVHVATASRVGSLSPKRTESRMFRLV